MLKTLFSNKFFASLDYFSEQSCKKHIILLSFVYFIAFTIEICNKVGEKQFKRVQAISIKMNSSAYFNAMESLIIKIGYSRTK